MHINPVVFAFLFFPTRFCHCWYPLWRKEVYVARGQDGRKLEFPIDWAEMHRNLAQNNIQMPDIAALKEEEESISLCDAWP